MACKNKDSRGISQRFTLLTTHFILRERAKIDIVCTFSFNTSLTLEHVLISLVLNLGAMCL